VESSCDFDDEPSASIKCGASQLVASRVVLSSIESVSYLKEGNHFMISGLDWRILLKWIVIGQVLCLLM
jgi:hypothetical protein